MDTEQTARGVGTSTEDGRRIAAILLEIGAVHVRPSEPFTFTSGRTSPVYVDCRKIISFPRARATIIARMVETVLWAAGHERFDAVAGGETAGIPYAAWMSERLGLPMLYVRKKPKGFGRDAQIEGDLREGQRVLLVEDLATDGGSKMNFIDALRTAGAEVAHVVVVFHYGIFPAAIADLASKGVTLHALATWWDVLAVIREQGRFTAAEIRSVEAFLTDPDGWRA